jgi:hypothetical protein
MRGGWFTQIFKIQGRALDARKRRNDVTTKPKPPSPPKPERSKHEATHRRRHSTPLRARAVGNSRDAHGQSAVIMGGGLGTSFVRRRFVRSFACGRVGAARRRENRLNFCGD